jgi:hypothetical protein
MRQLKSGVKTSFVAIGWQGRKALKSANYFPQGGG